MFFNAVPDLCRPEDLRVFSNWQRPAFRQALTCFARVISLDPLSYSFVFKQPFSIRDGRMRACGWQSHVPNTGTAHSAVIIGRPVSKEVSSKQIQPFLKS